MERDTTQEVDTVEEEVAVVVVDREMEETKGMEEHLLRLSETVLSSHRWASKDPCWSLSLLSISTTLFSLIFVLSAINFCYTFSTKRVWRLLCYEKKNSIVIYLILLVFKILLFQHLDAASNTQNRTWPI